MTSDTQGLRGAAPRGGSASTPAPQATLLRAFAPAAALLLSTVALGCAGERLDLPDWTIPVPESARLLAYAHVPIERRPQRIDLIEELVISQGREPFYRVTDVEADERDNMYVLDAGNGNIVAFDAAGAFLRTYGRPGEGPGEIAGGGRIAIVGGDIVHIARNRLNLWAADGEVRESRSLTFTRSLTPIAGTDSGILFGSFRQRDEEGTQLSHVVRVAATGELVHEYVTLPDPGPLSFTRISGETALGVNTMIPRPAAAFAASRSGDLYTTAGDEYQLLAFAPDGTPRWALRTTMHRPPLTDARIDDALRRLAGVRLPGGAGLDPAPTRSEVDWPAELPALAAHPIRVDGHGHLYVFPAIPEAWDGADQPVDVYSPAGERLFTGMLPFTPWSAARGDFVYGILSDPTTDEPRVVRYRLVEPFE